MRAVDTNILVYARRQEPREHGVARKLLDELCQSEEPWALPWPCVYEFLRVVTHPRLFRPPTPIEGALEAVEALLSSPSLAVLSEGERHPAILRRLLAETDVSGNLVYDAHIAALLIEHGVDEIITADDDFRRFTKLKVTNPFRP
jgi:uncharacterized protein